MSTYLADYLKISTRSLLASLSPYPAQPIAAQAVLTPTRMLLKLASAQLTMCDSSLQQGCLTQRGSGRTQMMVALPPLRSMLRSRLNLFLRKASGAVSRQPLRWQEPREVLNVGTGIVKTHRFSKSGSNDYVRPRRRNRIRGLGNEAPALAQRPRFRRIGAIIGKSPAAVGYSHYCIIYIFCIFSVDQQNYKLKQIFLEEQWRHKFELCKSSLKTFAPVETLQLQ